MALKEIFYSEAEKNLNFLQEVLERGGDIHESDKEIFLRLHTLKGDLSYLGDPQVMRDLAGLKESFSKSEKDEALALVHKIKNSVLGRRFFLTEDDFDLETYLRNIAASVASGLGKKTELSFKSNLKEPTRANLAFLKSVLTPLIVNCAAHGIEAPEQRKGKGKSETGLVQVVVKLSGEELQISVSDDGQGPQKEKKTERNVLKELYAGEGIGLSSVQALLSEKEGRVKATGKADQGFMVEMTLSQKKATL